MKYFLKISHRAKLCLALLILFLLAGIIMFSLTSQAYADNSGKYEHCESAEICKPVEVSDYYHLQCAINNSSASEDQPFNIVITDWIAIDATVVVEPGKHIVISTLDHNKLGFYRAEGFRDNMFSVGEIGVTYRHNGDSKQEPASLTFDGVSVDGGGEQIKSVVTKYDFSKSDYRGFDGGPTSETVERRETQSVFKTQEGSILNLYGVEIYDNRSNYFPTLNIGGRLKISNTAIAQNYSGDKYAIAYNADSKVYLDEFVQIFDNTNSKGDADMLICSQCKILIDRYFEMDSVVNVNYGPITIAEGTLLASTNCDDVEFFGDFGMAAHCFYIDDDWDLTPYVHDNQILALLCDMSQKDDGFVRGKGTIQDPYEISTAEELIRVSDFYQSSFIVVQNLNLQSYDWEGLCSDDAFEGFFNGKEHVIFNLKPKKDLDIDNETKGLFKFVGSSGLVGNYYINCDDDGNIVHV